MEFEIKFDKIIFSKLHLNTDNIEGDQYVDQPQWKTNLNIHTDFIESKKFRITFSLNLTSENNASELNLTAVSFFSTNQEITKEFQESQLVIISAPAIAFPYIRTFVSNVTLNSWQNPILLPMLNFVSMAQNSAYEEATNKLAE